MEQEFDESNNTDSFSFLSDDFFSEIEENLKSDSPKEGITALLNTIQLKSLNKKNANEFLLFLNKLHPASEVLLKFLNLLKEITIQDNILRLTISSSLFKLFKNSPSNEILITILTIILEGKICDIKILKDNKRENLIKKIDVKVKLIKDFESELISLFLKNKNNFEYIFLFSKFLATKNFSENSTKTISNEFAIYFENQVLDDSDLDKNLAKGRYLSKSLKYIDQNIIYETIIPSCESLILRTMKNFKFLEALFTNLSIQYRDDFISNLFSRFKDFFFSNDKLINESALNSIKKISQHADRNILVKSLLGMEFSADKVEQNLNICLYLVTILSHNNKFKTNDCFTSSELLEIILFCLKKLELMNENNKNKLENIFDLLVNALYHNIAIVCDNSSINSINSITENLNNQIKKIITNLNYSFAFGYLYMIIQILNEKFNLEISKNISDNLFNNISDITLTLSNMKNILPLISVCFTLASNNKELFNNSNANKKSLNDALNKTLLYNKENISSNVILHNNNFLNLSSLDFINILNVLIQITKNSESKENSESNVLFEYFADDEIPLLVKTVSHLLFRKNKSNAEEAFFDNFINSNSLKNKKVFDYIINSVFIFIVNFFNNKDSSNKVSFSKIKSLLQKYCELFYQEFDNKDFLKFMIISHIPNLYNDINIENHKNHTNTFLNQIYKKYSNLQINKDIFVQLEENYESLSQFIFSDMGIFNKNNKILTNSCYCLLTRMTENLSHNKFSKFISKDSFLNLNYDKFKYVDDLIKFYTKQVEYISFYDLTYLVENLKSVEKSSIDSLLGIGVGSAGVTNTNKKEETITKKNIGKSTKSSGTGKPVPVEKVDKDTKTKELRTYFDNFLVNLSLNENFIINRLKPILDLFNLNDIIIDELTTKDNLRKILKHLWRLLRVTSINTNLLNIIQNFLSNNKITKNFAFEFSHLMYLQINSDFSSTGNAGNAGNAGNDSLFNSVIENHPNLVINFNEKLEKIISLADDSIHSSEKHKLFKYFDFIVIKLLFFIILNNNISNDDKISSVNILVKIIETLPEDILNFNDISMLAVGLLKTSYNHDNLSLLLEIFLKRSKEENFLTLCEDLLDYEYVAKVTFLQQIINLNLVSIRKYKNLVYKMWILIFDENENISNMAKDIWNKFNLYLDTQFVHSDELALCFTDHKLKDSINRSVRAYTFLVKSEVKVVLSKFEQFYETEIMTLSEEDQEDENFDKYNRSTLRTVLFDYVDETIELFYDDMKQSLLDFLMRVSDKESDDEIFTMMNKTIHIIIKSIKSEELVQNILSSIEKNIQLISNKDMKEINYNNLKIILMMLNSILINTVDNLQVKAQKSSLYCSLHLLAKKLENSEVLCLISHCYQFLARDEIVKSEALMTSILDNFKNSKDKLVVLGDLYILSGLVRCFGINTYKTKNIELAVLENMKKTKTVIEKQNAILLIKVFSETLKRLYEPYMVKIFDQICELIADREDKVREYTTKAIKSFMKEISGYGVKSVMPRLIKDLHSMNWRSKVVNIEILGQFAFCAPKQLSIYIPKVIKEIMHVFKDPHEKVQETAVRVLKDISSVIKNPEIVELSSLLIDAISNPYENSKNALTALLETDFKHAIDPPSLALIIPIIDYNLKVANESLKKMAAHVIGSIAHLIGNPLDIYQYIDIIIPNLKTALFDSIPECRNAMAKAIGSLTKSLGVSYLNEMLMWVKSYLEIEVDTVQKSGAAQAYAEMLVAFGDGFIDKHIVHIIQKIQESNNIAKEGYLSIFVFLPGCLADKFEKYFELIFPLIIEGFSDDHENVRNVSNKIFEICIKLFAKRNAKQLVDPLLFRLFDANWRIRNSSIALIKTLIMNLNKEFFKESSTFFTKEQRDEILVFTFILKADNSGNTATIANMIWRDYVDNIPKYLSRVLKDIYEQLIVLLSSDKDECFDIAEGCIKMLVTKFSDKFFMELLPVIKDTIIERKDNENNVYASFYIFQLAASEASEKLLFNYKERFLRIVNENVGTPYSSVRKLLASIVYEIAKKFDDHSTNKTFIYNIMKSARGKPFMEQKSLLEIVGNLVDISKGDVLHLVINEIFRKPYEEGFLSLATMISGDIAKNLRDPTDVKELYQNLIEALNVIPNVTIDAIVSITTHLEDSFLPIFVDVLSKLLDKLEHTSLTTMNKNLPGNMSQIIYKFTEYTGQEIHNINGKLMEVNIGLLNFDFDSEEMSNSDLIKNVGESIKMIVDKAEKEESDKFLNAFLTKLKEMEEKYDLEGVDKINKLSDKFKFMMDNLLYLVQNGLLYAEDKSLACDYVRKVLEYTSRSTMKGYIMKMIGPMIRILSEKFSPEIKEKILDNINLLIVKSREDVKGIAPQLQSVFVKTLTDTTQVNSERCQIKAGENILRLLQFYPRPDVIVNDLMKSIVAKAEKNEFMTTIVETEILADIVRFYGVSLKPNVQAENYQKIQNILNSTTDVPYDYLVTVLAAFTKFKPDIIETQKMIEETIIKEELPRKLFNFLTLFNGNLLFFNQNKKYAIKIIKSLPKDQSVILLKTLGKIINKYRYFIDIDKTNFEKLLAEYEKVIENILIDTDLFVPTNVVIDGNLCVFILSLGYLNEYENNEKLFYRIFKYLLGLITQAKVNSQILVNCLSLLVLKEIKLNPDKESIIATLENMNVEEKEIDIVDSFLKKIYYLYN